MPVLSVAPSEKFVAVTPSDTAPLKYGTNDVRTKGLYVGVTGDLAIKNDLGDSIVFKNIPVGYFEVNTSYVMSTNTTASEIIALF